jgi:hypothetical protein
MTRTLRLLMVTCLTAVVTVLTPATAEASAYVFRPGDPMLDVPKHTETACTGSWAVRGRDGLFFMTAGHCFAKDAPVFGTDAQFGTADRNATGEGQDSMLVKPKAGVDAYQTVVAYKNWPGTVIGNVVGTAPKTGMNQNDPVGMSGWVSGWQAGYIKGRTLWKDGEFVLLASYISTHGDSGAPVLVNDGAGHVWAMGMEVGAIEVAPGKCYSAFIPIDDLLIQYGATLPTFPSAGITPPSSLADNGVTPHTYSYDPCSK